MKKFISILTIMLLTLGAVQTAKAQVMKMIQLRSDSVTAGYRFDVDTLKTLGYAPVAIMLYDSVAASWTTPTKAYDSLTTTTSFSNNFDYAYIQALLLEQKTNGQYAIIKSPERFHWRMSGTTALMYYPKRFTKMVVVYR